MGFLCLQGILNDFVFKNLFKSKSLIYIEKFDLNKKVTNPDLHYREQKLFVGKGYYLPNDYQSCSLIQLNYSLMTNPCFLQMCQKEWSHIPPASERMPRL